MDATGLGLTEPALVEKDEGMEEIKAGEGECGEVPEASIAAETLKHLVMERDQETKLALSPICGPGMVFRVVWHTSHCQVQYSHSLQHIWFCISLVLSSSSIGSGLGIICTEEEACAELCFLVRSSAQGIWY